MRRLYVVDSSFQFCSFRQTPRMSRDSGESERRQHAPHLMSPKGVRREVRSVSCGYPDRAESPGMGRKRRSFASFRVFPSKSPRKTRQHEAKRCTFGELPEPPIERAMRRTRQNGNAGAVLQNFPIYNQSVRKTKRQRRCRFATRAPGLVRRFEGARSQSARSRCGGAPRIARHNGAHATGLPQNLKWQQESGTGSLTVAVRKR